MLKRLICYLVEVSLSTMVLIGLKTDKNAIKYNGETKGSICRLKI